MTLLNYNFINIRHLTKKMVDALVEKIEIFSAGKVTVHLIYDDMLEELVAYTKKREAAQRILVRDYIQRNFPGKADILEYVEM